MPAPLLALWGFFKSPVGLAVTAGVAVLIAVAVIYGKGKSAGSADVRAKVNETTTSTIRNETNAINTDRETIRTTPYKDKLDALD